ncbi:YdcF family protein [Winogradskyella sp.]|uniref:YdcF family protein n=1 Tax=Winogradskyella sp. TaxID=1883156 RepID=UPI003BA95B80
MEIIVVPDEGYSISIYVKAARLHKKHQCPIIVTGANRDPETQGSYGLKKLLEKAITPIPVEKQIARVIDLNVKHDHIIHEKESGNTKENAINTLKIIEGLKGVQKLHLVYQFDGILRKHLTFKKTITHFENKLNIVVHPTFDLFPLHIAFFRIVLMPSELLRIIRYKIKGDL